MININSITKEYIMGENKLLALNQVDQIWNELMTLFKLNIYSTPSLSFNIPRFYKLVKDSNKISKQQGNKD